MGVLRAYAAHRQQKASASLMRRAKRAEALALAREAVVYRAATPSEYRLSQAADYACAVELTALKYQAHEETATDRRFFGSWGTFRRNVLKTVRKKAF